MSWQSKFISWFVGGSVAIVYATGYDSVLMRSLMNAFGGLFTYCLAKFMQFMFWLLGLIPAIPSDSTFVLAAEQFISILGRANTFFPIVEFVLLLIWFITAYIILIVVRFLCIIWKLVPGKFS